MSSKRIHSAASVTAAEALEFHAMGRPGKFEITPTKPMATQRDLSLAEPVKAIAEDPSRAFDYTTRGNMVAVISNGTAILGLGNLGALASKPVVEGRSSRSRRAIPTSSIWRRSPPLEPTAAEQISAAAAMSAAARHPAAGVDERQPGLRCSAACTGVSGGCLRHRPRRPSS